MVGKESQGYVFIGTFLLIQKFPVFSETRRVSAYSVESIAAFWLMGTLATELIRPG